MDESEDIRTPAEEDARTESAVLYRVLELHPAQITIAELTRELGGQAAGFAQRDAIARAVRDLAGAGLLHDHDGFVLPTRAALRFFELFE
ncbi:MAG TPA: hypothetical protein VG518_08090 [Solirubrobacterales bacterium]|nr:hypothetical protein [Solirubrobacterales bacterium]